MEWNAAKSLLVAMKKKMINFINGVKDELSAAVPEAYEFGRLFGSFIIFLTFMGIVSLIISIGFYITK